MAEPMEALYESSLSRLLNLDEKLLAQSHELSMHLGQTGVEVAAQVDRIDVLASVAFGIIGAWFSTADRAKVLLDQVHEDARRNKKSVWGRLLGHGGDSIDRYYDRMGRPVGVKPHRRSYGHDPLSFRSDNPFILLSNQEVGGHRRGVLGGMIQTFRHLTADTFSAQGLPIPGHSWFEYESEGQLSNYLMDIINRVTDNQNDSEDVFHKAFSIRMQDALSQGLVFALTAGYIKVRGVEDKIRAGQIRLISYSSNFLAYAALGLFQYGFPYINYPALAATIKQFIVLLRLSHEETRRLGFVTDEICRENEQLEKRVFATGQDLVSYESGSGYIQEQKRQDAAFEDLMDFLSEEVPHRKW